MGIETKNPTKNGRFGHFGGQFVAPILLPVLDRLEAAFDDAWKDAEFRDTLNQLLHRYVGRPTPLFDIPRFASRKDGAQIVLKRDDLTFNGGNYANSAVGQCLLAKRMGLNAVVADTGSGQNGIATAAVAARFGMECTIYIGASDAARQPSTVKKMTLFGAKVQIVEDADRALSAATSAATRHWMGHSDTTTYVAGAPIGPHPYPAMVAAFQAVIGRETRLQLIDQGLAPSVFVSAVGGGASTIGLFSAFLDDPQVRLMAVEGAGEGDEKSAHSARLGRGCRGVFHGAETMVLADAHGQIISTSSIAPGLSYPGSSPQLAHLVETGRIETMEVSNAAAKAAVLRLAKREGILLCLEAGHALAAAEGLAAQLSPDQTIVVMAQSSGDKDIETLVEETPQ